MTRYYLDPDGVVHMSKPDLETNGFIYKSRVTVCHIIDVAFPQRTAPWDRLAVTDGTHPTCLWCVLEQP